MVVGQKQLVWVVMACATLIAPAAPEACCCSTIEPAAICHAACCGAEAAPETCFCQLDGRQAEPGLPAKNAVPPVDDHERGIAPAVVAVHVPQTLGVSREYLAASLGVPIRPLRILCGVWRN